MYGSHLQVGKPETNRWTVDLSPFNRVPSLVSLCSSFASCV
jgi:hypothetical protein